MLCILYVVFTFFKLYNSKITPCSHPQSTLLLPLWLLLWLLLLLLLLLLLSLPLPLHPQISPNTTSWNTTPSALDHSLL